MKNEWIVIEIPVPGCHVDLVSAILGNFNCGGVVIEDQALDSFIIPDDRLIPDFVYHLKAYFEDVGNPRELSEKIETELAKVPALSSLQLSVSLPEKVKVEDWAENWKQNFSLMRIGARLVIRPSWENYTPKTGEVVVEIDPGMAFGTGTHATTLLCLELITELLEEPAQLTSMLDVGTGSGILALGAAALECPEICAIDIDQEACDIARQNVGKNGLAGKIKISDESLEQLPGTFDLVVANILAEENLRLKNELFKHVNPGGWLILSGILLEKETLVREGFDDFPLETFPTRIHEDWVCLLYRR